MIYNYHTHTYRCNHALGTPEEYIKRATENGIKYMGFSDHIPLKFPEGTESNYRISESEGKTYCEEIKSLKEKYKENIEIAVGFEMEYYPEYFDSMLASAIEYGGEYLILGQHFTGPENTYGRYVYSQTDNVQLLKKYVSLVVSAMDKKVFTYVAHPDIINFTGDVLVYQNEIRKICVTSRELDIPLEINFLGIRGNRCYPNDNFWQIAGEEKSPVTFGFDSHDTLNAYDGVSLDKAKKIVEKYNLNYIGKPKLILIK